MPADGTEAEQDDQPSILQLHFSQPSDQRELLPLLISISKATWAILNLRLAELGLDWGQNEVLLAIDPFRPCTLAELAQRLSIRVSALVKIVDHLVRRGLITQDCEPTKANSPSVSSPIRITPAGSETRMKLDLMHLQLEEELTSTLQATELLQLRRDLGLAERQLARQVRPLR